MSYNYLKYDNKFTKINVESLKKYKNNYLTLSYSSIDAYFHCAFKFYISNILKLNIYEENFMNYIGSLFHFVLSKYYEKDFDLILCRNVIIYFKDEVKQKIIDDFIDSLKVGGLLFVGATESINTYRTRGLEKVSPFIYKKI